MSADPELLTIAELAPVMRTSVRAIQRAIKDGTFPLPVIKPSPGKRLVSRVALDRYLATGEAKAAS